MKRKLLIAVFLILGAFSLTFAQEYGTASYYSDEFNGLETAYGVKYNKNELTASHKTHPLGTLLKVSRLDNKKSVTVKVIDKGPWIKGRIVDLSRKAAEAIDLISDGVADVKVEVVGKNNAVAANTNKRSTPKPAETKTETDRPSEYLKTPSNFQKPTTTNSASSLASNTAKSNDNLTAKGGNSLDKVDPNKKYDVKSDGNAKVVRQGYSGNGLYKIVLMQPEKKGFGVQIASFVSYENVMRKVAELQGKWFDNVLVNSAKTKTGKKTYKVILGPFKTASAASTYGKNLKRKNNIEGFVVDLTTL